MNSKRSPEAREYFRRGGWSRSGVEKDTGPMIEAVLIGVAAGGLKALGELLPLFYLNPGFAVIIVQHRQDNCGFELIDILSRVCQRPVKEAQQLEVVRPGVIYIAPGGYHLLVEGDQTFSLSNDTPVNYARPSIDAFFESAAAVYEDRLVGIILTGANADGAAGLAAIKRAGGLTVVQEPAIAEAPSMPREAIRASRVDHVLPLR